MTKCAFGPLVIAFDDRVLRPRSWTTVQSEWAAELAADLPPGPILELCSGAGQIGILAAVLTGRPLIQVEADGTAVDFARQNADAAGIGERIEIRHARLQDAVGAGERFSLILADPPYLPTADIGRFPEDPVVAIDGGDDGLTLIRDCLAVADSHLVDDGLCLMQVAGPPQVAAVADITEADWPRLKMDSSRTVDSERAVALIRRV